MIDIIYECRNCGEIPVTMIKMNYRCDGCDGKVMRQVYSVYSGVNEKSMVLPGLFASLELRVARLENELRQEKAKK